MSLHILLNMVDEFGRQMRDDAKQPGAIHPATLNRTRERLHEGIKALAAGKLDDTLAAWYGADKVIETAAKPSPNLPRPAAAQP